MEKIYDIVNLDVDKIVTSTYSYNFAPLTVNNQKIAYGTLRDPLQVLNGATLYINSNQQRRWLNLGLPSYSEPNPPSPSTFYAELCSLKLSVQETGLLVVGDHVVDNKAILQVKAGSILEIGSPNSTDPGKLEIANNSRVIIEPGAKLIYHPGAIIELKGENAVLEIQGELEISDGASFSYIGNGHINFSKSTQSINPIITGQNNNSRIGLSFFQKQLVWKVEDDVKVDIGSNVVGILFNNAHVQLGKNAVVNTQASFYFINSELSSINPSEPYYSFNIDLTGIVPSPPPVIYSDQRKVTIEQSNIHHGNIGLFVRSEFWIPVNVLQSSFASCQTGFSTLGGKVNIKNTSFTNNGTGWFCGQTGLGVSLFESSIASENSTGIRCGLDGSAKLRILKSDFIRNITGTEGYGNGIIQIKCSNYIDNDIYGIHLRNGTILEADKTVSAQQQPNTGAQLSMSGGTTDIYCQKAGALRLDYGYNSIQIDSDNILDIYGSLTEYTTTMNPDYYIQAFKNQWGPGFTPPDFSQIGLQTLNGDPVGLYADYEVIASDVCEELPTFKQGIPGGIIVPGTEYPCLDCQNINTREYSNMPLNEAVYDAKTERQAFRRMDKHTQILTYGYQTLSTEEKKLLKIAYEGLYEAAGDVLKENIADREGSLLNIDSVKTVLEEVQQIQLSRFDTSQTDYYPALTTMLDRGSLYSQFGDQAAALAAWDNDTRFVSAEDRSFWGTRYCIAELVVQYQNRAITLDELSMQLTHVNCSDLIPTIPEIADTSSLQNGGNTSEMTMSIYPNPASGSVTIAKPGSKGEIRVYNSQGILVLSVSFEDILTLDVSGFPGGLYTVEFISTNGEVTSGKVVIQ